jgi:molybdenum cofactor cytidylyltransferase
VVGGHQFEVIRDILRDYERVEVVLNERFESGMFGSIKEGLRHVRAERFFLLPGDHPLVGENLYRRLLEEQAPVVLPVCKGYKGHPVLMDSRFIPDILNEPDSANLRDFIRRVGFRAIEVSDERILLDVDTLSDFDAVKRQYERGY